MTIMQAVAKWGYSKNAIVARCRDGRIPGAKKVQTAFNSNKMWFIPDNAEKPTDITKPRGRHSSDVAAKLKSADGQDPVVYVWAHQGDATIGQLAEKLGVTVERVKELYEEGFSRFLPEEDLADE